MNMKDALTGMEEAPDAIEARFGTAQDPGASVIANFVKQLPAKPGVYRMIGAKGEVLYVGKAKSLKTRVSNYCNSTGHSNRITRMISETSDMEFVVTQSETEALLLEANLIKKLKPRYNIILRDDKSFPYILVTEDHAAPQILKHRGAKKRKGTYYGPFASAGAVNNTLNTLQKAFLLRSCSDSVYESRTRPCLLHQIKRCSAPCVELISRDDYDRLVYEAKEFLSGKNAKIQKELSEKMETSAHALEFERAAALRDRIRALSVIQGSQNVNTRHLDDCDLFAINTVANAACVQVFFIRGGQNWGNRAYFLKRANDNAPGAILESFIAQFYDSREPPKEILTSETLPQSALLHDALSMKSNRKVSIIVPTRGEKRRVVDDAVMNAKEALQRRMAEGASQRKAMSSLSSVLKIDAPVERIEVYDNSHIQGDDAVGAMIVAGPDGFQKNQYRKFNIDNKSIEPGDDYAMMREVLKRRFSRLLKEENAEVPDLVIIDGGVGHLSTALGVFSDLGIDPESYGFVVIGVSKARRMGSDGAKKIDRTMSTDSDQVVMPGRPPFIMPARDPALHFLQRLRDEAHRFAIGAHRSKRTKKLSSTPLSNVPGVGAKRKRALLNHFGSAKEVARAKPEDLEAVDGISSALAMKIYDYFHALD